MTVSVANHQYHSGEYKIHVYVRCGNGLERAQAYDNILFLTSKLE